MNENTKQALLEFVDAVGRLAYHTVQIIGEKTAREILDSCNKLTERIKKDETLP